VRTRGLRWGVVTAYRNIEPTYALLHDGEPVAVDEGSSTRWNVATTNVPDGTTLYWTILDITTHGIDDFTAVSGSCVITANASFFDVAPVTDSLSEGNEYFRVQLRTGSISGTVVATAGTLYDGDFRVTDTTSGTQPTFALRPTTIIEAEGNYYIGLQNNPDTGSRNGGFYRFNKTTGVITNYSNNSHETSMLVYDAGYVYYASASNGSSGSNGLHKVNLTTGVDTIGLNYLSNGAGPVGLAFDGEFLWTNTLHYYSWEVSVGQRLCKVDRNLNIISFQQLNTPSGQQNRYPEGYNVYIDSGYVWATEPLMSSFTRATLDNTSKTQISAACSHLAFSPTYIFASGSNAIKKINKTTLTIEATYTLTGCRHILYIPEINKLAINVGNTITYMNVDGSIDNVVALPSGFTDPRQSIYSGGVLLTACYGNNKVNNLYNP